LLTSIFRFQQWNLGEEGNFEKQIKNRGVLDPKILPYYPYRDDGVPLYNAITKYVTRAINYFYGIIGAIV
jgi:arachidonate 5-lipoxygenase